MAGNPTTYILRSMVSESLSCVSITRASSEAPNGTEQRLIDAFDFDLAPARESAGGDGDSSRASDNRKSLRIASAVLQVGSKQSNQIQKKERGGSESTDCRRTTDMCRESFPASTNC